MNLPTIKFKDTSYLHEMDCSTIMSMSQPYRRTNTTVSLINHHFVWIPRRRRKVLVNDVKKTINRINP